MEKEIKFEYGFKSQNGIVTKVYDLWQIPRIAEICDVWNELPIAYVRQATGLKCTNKAEIYDGDKLRMRNEEGFFDGVVSWHDGAWIIIFDDNNEKDWLFEYTGSDHYEIEVIGTIHDVKEQPVNEAT